MRLINVKGEVLNRPDHQVEKYIVAKAVDGELWYWGSWKDENEARRIAKQFDNGCVLELNEE